jgi:hypothetical protein
VFFNIAVLTVLLPFPGFHALFPAPSRRYRALPSQAPSFFIEWINPAVLAVMPSPRKSPSMKAPIPKEALNLPSRRESPTQRAPRGVNTFQTLESFCERLESIALSFPKPLI